VELLALGGPALSFNRLDFSLYKAVGRPSMAFHVASAQLLATIPAVLIGVHWGIEGVAIGVVVVGYLALPGIFLIRARLLEQRLVDQVRPLAPIMVATLVMTAVALGVRVLAVEVGGDVVALLATVVAGSATYVAVLRLLDAGLVRDVVADLRRAR